MTEISFQLRIGGKVVPATEIEVTGSSYGSVGHATLQTSLTALKSRGIDLYSLTSSSSGITEVSIAVTMGNKTTRIFGGEHLMTSWHLDQDSVQIHARSWAGILVDQKRVLTKIANAITGALAPLVPGQISAAGISSQNQTLGNIVTSIANEFGFTPVLNMTNGNPTIGTLYGSSDQTFMPVPQSLWSILNQIARDTGYVVYDTPKKELVFGTPGAGVEPLNLFFGKASKGGFPSRNVRLEHQPRRNSTFRVLVISYDPAQRRMAIGKASYVGRNFAGSNGLSPGLSVGTAATGNDSKLAKLDQGTGTIALYTFHHDGLDQAQAETLAAAIATDIAKRELIISATIDGYPGATPAQVVKMTGDVPAAFAAAKFYASGFTHTFRMPTTERNHGTSSGGFITEIKALNIPTEALAAESAG